MRILVAEDEPVSRRLLESTLRRWEHNVEAVADGTKALEILAGVDPPKLAILDWMMPGLNGAEICRALRKTDRGRSLYLLLLSSKASKEDAIECLDAGADDFISKPFDPAELRARVSVGIRLVGLRMELEARMKELAERTAQLQQANERLTLWGKELEQRNSEINLLGEMGGLLQSCNTSAEAYAATQAFARRLFPEDPGALFVFGESRQTVEAVAVWGETPPEERVFALDDCWALRRGRVHGGADIEAGLRCRHVAAGHAAYVCVPMTAHGATLGLLHILLTASDSEQREARQSLGVRVGEHLGLALAKLKMQEALQHLSVRDPLTGLFNRRYMEESLERELRRAERLGKSLGILMLDIDHFKRFNDTLGHDAGDSLLRELGNLLPRQIRSSDIASRYGGEEFCIVLPEASAETTRQRAEEIREAANGMRVQHGQQVLDAVTLSLGVATFPQNGRTRDALMKSADLALYRAKSEGRNRVCVAESP